jgi:hypothetical protein
MDPKAVPPHLTDAELFTLAVPPAGEPEALPRHLSECFRCSRALQEWKIAVREIADEETEALDRRSAADWEALENGTIEALRRAGRRRHGSAVRWALSVAAAVLLAVLMLPAMRRAGREVPRPATAVASLSAQDETDDALLRDVARLSRDEDNGSWNTLAPEPGGARGPEEDQL